MTFRVGLTGGIGSGKSAAARRFGERGALVIDADVLAREAVAPGTPGLAAIARHWPNVITAEGTLDRAALSAVVFEDARARGELNAIVHPRVRALGAEREATAAPGQLIVHEVPLLFESDFWKRCAATVLVYAPVEIRLARVLARDGFTREAVLARMAAQIDQEAARERAGYVIENTGDMAHLHAQVDRLYDVLVARMAAQE